MSGPPGSGIKVAPKSDSIAVSDTIESTYEFRGGTSAFSIKANALEEIRISWKATEVVAGDDFLTILPGQTYYEDGILIGTKATSGGSDSGTAEVKTTIYLHAPSAAASVEVGIISWL